MKKYDLIVIGSGPGGEKAAVKAAYFGYKVAIIDKEDKLGGSVIVSGIPSKTMRETALFFSGKYEKGRHGSAENPFKPHSLDEFMYLTKNVVDAASSKVRNNILDHKVDIYKGIGEFVDSHTVKITAKDGSSQEIQADFIIIATGAYPLHPGNIPFDSKRVHDYQSLITIEEPPKSVCIAGAGAIGCEYATMMSTMGVKVYLTDLQAQINPFLDKEISTYFINLMEKDGIVLLLNEKIADLKVPKNNNELLTIDFESGSSIQTEMFIFATGQRGNTRALQCERAGIKIGKQELIEVNKKYQTNVSHVYAVGDVIGFPSLASTSMDQGRVAVTHIFNTKDFDSIAKAIPYGLWTIPEISMVGITEEEAIGQNISYCTGKAYYNSIPRGKIMGTEDGLMKIIFRRDNQAIIGVHIIGNMANELIHYGMSLVDDKKTIEEVISVVFNYPTFHELYKYACYNCLTKIP